MARNRGDIDLRMVDQWRATGKLPSPKKLFDVLAKIVDYNRLDGSDPEEVLVHVHVLDLIAEMLGGRREWLAARNRAAALAARKRRSKYQTAAEFIWKTKPRLSNQKTAEEITRRIGGNPNTIRRKIRKK